MNSNKPNRMEKEQLEETAKKIALLLSESKAHLEDIDFIFLSAKSFLIVSVENN